MPLNPTNLPTDITEGELGHIGDSETVHSVINELTSVAGADRVGTADGSTVEEALAAKENVGAAAALASSLSEPGGAGMVGSTLPGGNVAAVLAALAGERIKGTGFPSAAAPVGTIYVDTNATNGAVLWIKASGTGTSGWRVLYGDTGWRALTTWNASGVVSGTPLPPGWEPTSGAAGGIYVRRCGDAVYAQVTYITVAIGDTTDPMILLPAGFGSRGLFETLVVFESTPRRMAVIAQNQIRRAQAQSLPVGAAAVGASFALPAEEPWPSTLPGTPG